MADGLSGNFSDGAQGSREHRGSNKKWVVRCREANSCKHLPTAYVERPIFHMAKPSRAGVRSVSRTDLTYIVGYVGSG